MSIHFAFPIPPCVSVLAPSPGYSINTSQPLLIMSWKLSFCVGSIIPKIRIPLFEVRMFCILVRLMCFQNGPQQAAGVVGYQQFPFLNQPQARPAGCRAEMPGRAR